jgi:hypothetical protein
MKQPRNCRKRLQFTRLDVRAESGTGVPIDPRPQGVGIYTASRIPYRWGLQAKAKNTAHGSFCLGLPDWRH